MPSRRTRLASEALELAEAAGDVPALAQAHNLLGILASGWGEHGPARAQLERSSRSRPSSAT